MAKKQNNSKDAKATKAQSAGEVRYEKQKLDVLNQRISAEEKILKLKELEVNYNADLLSSSTSITESIKDLLNIRSRLSESEKISLDLSKKLTSEILSQSTASTNIEDSSKRLNKSKELANKFAVQQKVIEQDLNSESKKRVVLANNRAGNLQKEREILDALLAQAEKIEKSDKKAQLHQADKVKNLEEEAKASGGLGAERSSQLQKEKKILDEMRNDSAKGRASSSKSLKLQVDKVGSLEKELVTKIENMNQTEQELFYMREGKKTLEDVIKKEETRLAILNHVEDAMGVAGAAISTMNKLLGGSIKSLGKIEEQSKKRLILLAEQNKLQQGFLGKMQAIRVMGEEIGKTLVKSFSDPLVIMVALVDAAFEFSKSVTTIQREFSLGAKAAEDMKMQFAELANTSTEPALNSMRMQKAWGDINAEMGTAVEYNDALEARMPGMVEDLATMQELWGMSNKEMKGMYTMSNLSGKSIKQSKLEIMGGINAMEQQSGIRLNEKQIVKEVSALHGVIRSQMSAQPGLMGETVARAKELGMTLEGIVASGRQLLNFESSIENELKAELLTGKQLNLEKARLAALTGDYKTLIEEINDQVGDFGDFSKLNVLQQEALAEAVGMTADGLADQLARKADLGALAAEARAEGDEERAKAIEARDLQQKFNDAMMELKQIFVDIVGGPVGELLTALASAVKVVANIIGPIVNKLMPVLKPILTIFLLVKGAIMATNAALGVTKGIMSAINFTTNAQYRAEVKKNMAKKAGIITDKAELATKTSTVGMTASQRMHTVAVNTAKRLGLISEQQANLAKGRYTIMQVQGIGYEKVDNFHKNQGLFTQIRKNLAKKLGLGQKKVGVALSAEEAAVENTSLLTQLRKGIVKAANIIKDRVALILGYERNASDVVSLSTATTKAGVEQMTLGTYISQGVAKLYNNIKDTVALGIGRAKAIVENSILFKMIAQGAIILANIARKGIMLALTMGQAVAENASAAMKSFGKIPYVGWIVGIAAAVAGAALIAGIVMSAKKSHGGGLITDAMGGTGGGDIPITAQSGELMMQKSTVNAIGPKTLDQVNKTGKLPMEGLSSTIEVGANDGIASREANERRADNMLLLQEMRASREAAEVTAQKDFTTNVTTPGESDFNQRSRSYSKGNFVSEKIKGPTAYV